MNSIFELIPLEVEASAKITKSNLPEFRDAIRDALKSVNRNPQTDEEFGQAESDVKSLKNGEKWISEAQEKLLADAGELNELLSQLKDSGEEVRAARLELEKLVADAKERVKDALIEEFAGRVECADRLRSRFTPGLRAAIKGRRTPDTICTALEIEVAAANASITKNRAAIAAFGKTHGEELVSDADELEIGSVEACEAELRRRFDAKRAAEQKRALEAEAQREREAAAQARAEADKAKRDAEAQKAAPIRGMLPPSDLPPPRKVGTLPTGPSPAAEWAAWIDAARAAFAPLKAARGELLNPGNAAKAGKFADAVAQAWKEMVQ